MIRQLLMELMPQWMLASGSLGWQVLRALYFAPFLFLFLPLSWEFLYNSGVSHYGDLSPEFPQPG